MSRYVTRIRDKAMHPRGKLQEITLFDESNVNRSILQIKDLRKVFYSMNTLFDKELYSKFDKFEK